MVERSKEISDINEHLVEIYDRAIEMKPELIVELGVSNTFNSTVALSEVAKDLNCEMISMDISDCQMALAMIRYNKWRFHIMDDTNIEEVDKLLHNRKIDVLFIDTSHGYNHTMKELEMYNKYLNNKYLIILHDTNSSNTASRVQIAIQDYYHLDNLSNTPIDWTKDFKIALKEGIEIKNDSKNNGVAYITNIVRLST